MSAIAGRYVATEAADTLAVQRRTMLYFLVAGFSALMIGASIGPLQALNYGGINAYPWLHPVLQTYYQGLTIHGVLNGYAFPFLVTGGLLVYLPARELGLAPNMMIWRLALGMMVLGTMMLLYAMFDNSSSVLYTIYPPLRGSATFYIGLALLAVGSVVPLPVVLGLRARWKAQRPGQITPLVTYMSTATMLMWFLAALGAAAELVFQLIPWSLGIAKAIDPAIARTLFWWTGHPIVYFWLMPGYVSWYGLLPRQIGGKLVSDPMARLAFAMLMVLSVPVGIHHQFQDPGISQILRGIVTFLTFSVALPSLLTAFTIALTLEYAGRLRGGRGIFGWFTALPWSNPSVAAQILAMLTFIFGGAGGIVNGSWQLDNIVHNTVWIPGHFHVTVGTATALSFMGISLWLLPHLTGRKLFAPQLGKASIWLWFIGMSIFAWGMHWAGLYGVPRRAWISQLPHSVYEHVYGVATPGLTMTAIGGVIMWLSIASFYIMFIGSLFSSKLDEPEQIPFGQAMGRQASYSLEGPQDPAAASRDHDSALARGLDHLGLITLFTAAITFSVYTIILWPMWQNYTYAHGWVVW